MKTFNKLFAAGLLALSVGSLASAQVILNVAGSTAFRTAAVNGEIAAASFAATSTVAVPVAQAATSGYTLLPGSTATNGAVISIVHGWLVDGTEVYYRNHWTGACAGPADLTIGNQTLSWIPATPAILAQLTTSGFGFPVGTEAVDSTAPSVAFSDSQFLDAQNSVVTQGTVGKAFAGIMSTAVANEGLSDAGAGTPVGAVVFEWVLGVQGDGNPAPFTNITQQQAAALIKTGFLPLSVFTGNAADSSNYVILTGRNEDSGTRYDTFAESQTGFGQNAVQFMIKQANHAYPANNLYPFSSGTALSVDTGIAGFQSWPKTAGANSWAFNTDPTLDWKTAATWPRSSGHPTRL
jgi:hypothetical protein